MSVVILSTGYFPDPDIGKPIANGYIYVGKVDLDPTVVANQKQISVLQEDGSEVAVSQPLRTSSGGVPTYNGSPVTIIAASPYSLLVQDSTQAQKIYSPSNTGSSQANENWSEEGAAVAFVTAATFTVDGDVTSVYTAHRGLKLTQTANDTGFVVSSSYAAGPDETTVTVRAATVDSGLSKVEYGIEVAASPGGSDEDFHANIVGDVTGDVTGNVSGRSNSTVTSADYIAIGQLSVDGFVSGKGVIGIGYDCVRGAINGGVGGSIIGIGTGTLASATGLNNTGVGGSCLNSITTGTGCTAMGTSCLRLATGSFNSGLGENTLIGVTTGTTNTGCGYSAGSTLTTGSNCSFLGNNAQPSAVGVSSEITLGNSSIATLRCQVALTVLSDKRDKTEIEDIPIGLNFINDLRPVKFKWNRRDGSKKGIKEAGFIAQEVDSIQDKYDVSDFMNLIYKSNPEKLEMTKENLLPVMVKAIQELSAKVKELEDSSSL